MALVLLRRVAAGLATLWAVTLLIFVLTQVLPGDVAAAVLGNRATPETLAAFRAQLGLDAPAWQRYLDWLMRAATGDLGTALTNGRAIAGDLLPRLGNTLFLAGFAAALAVPVALSLGIVAAIRAGSWIDHVAGFVTLTAISLPEFFVGHLLILGFAVTLPWLPSLAAVTPEMSLWGRLTATLLPAVALMLLTAAHMLRTTRTALLAEMAKPYAEMALLKGASRARVVLRHALPNAAAPIVAVIALNLAYLVVGVVVVETVFVYPGIGQYMVDAVAKRDVPVVQACGLAFAAVFVTLNLAADLAALALDPRLGGRR